MELDVKQQVLMAIYTEYQKDLPDMNSITSEALGVDEDVFTVAMLKLENEGWINGLEGHYFAGSKLPSLVMDDVMMSREGIHYVEQKAEIDRTLSALEKVKRMGVKSAEWGLEQLKDITSKTAAEILKKSIGGPA